MISECHSGDENQRGEAVILDKRDSQLCGKVRYKCDRLLMVKVTGKPVDMCIIQVQATEECGYANRRIGDISICICMPTETTSRTKFSGRGHVTVLRPTER